MKLHRFTEVNKQNPFNSETPSEVKWKAVQILLASEDVVSTDYTPVDLIRIRAQRKKVLKDLRRLCPTEGFVNNLHWDFVSTRLVWDFDDTSAPVVDYICGQSMNEEITNVINSLVNGRKAEWLR